MTKKEAERAGWIVGASVESVYSMTKADFAPDRKYTAHAVMSVGNMKVILSSYGRTKLQASTRLLVAIEQYEKNMPKAEAEGRA